MYNCSFIWAGRGCVKRGSGNMAWWQPHVDRILLLHISVWGTWVPLLTFMICVSPPASQALILWSSWQRSTWIVFPIAGHQSNKGKTPSYRKVCCQDSKWWVFFCPTVRGFSKCWAKQCRTFPSCLSGDFIFPVNIRGSMKLQMGSSFAFLPGFLVALWWSLHWGCAG